jgi:hypothetical protein
VLAVLAVLVCRASLVRRELLVDQEAREDLHNRRIEAQQ